MRASVLRKMYHDQSEIYGFIFCLSLVALLVVLCVCPWWSVVAVGIVTLTSLYLYFYFRRLAKEFEQRKSP